MISSIHDFKNVFFIGVAGAGMSAIAQYLAGIKKNVSGSDRYFHEGEFNETKEKLEVEGIKCFLQNGDGITGETDLVVVSTAIEDTVFEVQKAKQLNIPIIKRSELLAIIAKSKRTIAVGGTSGKSTTSAMLFDILEHAGMQPSIISGAGLVSIIKEGKIGNAKVGAGEWLVIEADESDGSIVQYHPEIGLLLNVDKDHQEIDELMNIFGIFKNNSKRFIVNQSNALAKQLSQNIKNDFATDENSTAGFIAKDFKQEGFNIKYSISNIRFSINTIGKHNMENALAAVAVANQIGVLSDQNAQVAEQNSQRTQIEAQQLALQVQQTQQGATSLLNLDQINTALKGDRQERRRLRLARRRSKCDRQRLGSACASSWSCIRRSSSILSRIHSARSRTTNRTRPATTGCARCLRTAKAFTTIITGFRRTTATATAGTTGIRRSGSSLRCRRSGSPGTSGERPRSESPKPPRTDQGLR